MKILRDIVIHIQFLFNNIGVNKAERYLESGINIGIQEMKLINEQVWRLVSEQVLGQVVEQVWVQASEQVRTQISEQVWRQVGGQISKQVWEQTKT